MTKNDLIKKLQSIKGNPQIVIWNGHVDDYMPIGDISEDVLVKYSREFFEYEINYSYMHNKSALTPEDIEKYINNARKHDTWEFPNPFLEKERYANWYGKNIKKVLMITPKLRNKSSWSRGGKLSY